MADDIGSVRGINGTSISLNNQPGAGTQKPGCTNKTDTSPSTSPGQIADKSVPMPK